jgi:hypothetical protein
LALRRVFGEHPNAGERARRHREALPPDDLAIVIVVRGLGQNKLKAPFRLPRRH